MKRRLSVLLFLVTFLFQGCGYQEETLPPLNQPTDVSQDVNVRPTSNEPGVIETGTEVRIDNESDVLKKDIFDLWDIFFKTFVVKVGNDGDSFDTLVNYEGLQELRVKEDKDFLALVAAIEKKMETTELEGKSREYQLAFYINSYNYSAIRLINKNYKNDGKKINKILDLSRGLSKYEIFSRKMFKVAGQKISLDDMEKVKVKSLMTSSEGKIDARFHFAVICVSKSCPITYNQAFRENKIEQQLDFVTKEGLGLPRMVINNNSKRLTSLSRIFNWYEDDFKSKFGSVKGFIHTYRPDVSVYDKAVFHKYDWNLNNLAGEVSVPVLPDLGELVVVVDEDETDESGSGTSSGSTVSSNNACSEYLNDENFAVVTTCEEVKEGRLDGTYKYKVELKKAKLCLLASKVVSKKMTLKIVGTVSEIKDGDESEKLQIVEIDGEGRLKSKKDGKVLTFKNSKNKIRTMVSFDTDTRELTLRQTASFGLKGYRKAQLICK